MIGTVEQAIIDRLRLANDHDVFGYDIRQIDSYGGQAGDDVAEHVKGLPAIWVTYDGANIETQVSRGPRHNHKYIVVVAARSLRNESEGRRGSHRDVGVYQLARDVISVLHGFVPVMDKTKGLRIGAITPIAAPNTRNRNAAIYAINITTEFGIEAMSPNSALESPLKAIHTNWDLPPVKITGPLPDDENADATDHLTGDMR